MRPQNVVAVLWHGTCLVFPSTSWYICFHPSPLKQSRVNSGRFSRPELGVWRLLICSSIMLSKTWLCIHRHTLRTGLNEWLWKSTAFLVASTACLSRFMLWDSKAGEHDGLMSIYSLIPTPDCTCSYELIWKRSMWTSDCTLWGNCLKTFASVRGLSGEGKDNLSMCISKCSLMIQGYKSAERRLNTQRRTCALS